MADESFQERSEEATSKRREDARKKGQAPRSREITSVSVLLMGVLIFHLLGGYIYLQTANMLRGYLGHLSAPMDAQGVYSLLWQGIRSFLGIVWPFLLGLTATALLVGYLQTGRAMSAEQLQPKWDKINFIKGFQRIISLQSLVELVKSLAKIALVGGVAFRVVRAEFEHFTPLVEQDAWQIVSYIGGICLRMSLWTLLAMAALAVLDYGFQRWQHEKQLRMTRQEVKEEFKQTEGNPLIKSRIRSLQRQMARRRMMAELPKADVLVTNPTELAVALRYVAREMKAPKVVAKGAGFIALRMREMAREYGIPIVEDKPLARALYKTVEINQAVPFQLYAAVAEVLAYVFRLKRKRA
ncbi:MAG: flagellar biosynthesis protein FlhB [Pseudomonadota bacterium]